MSDNRDQMEIDVPSTDPRRNIKKSQVGGTAQSTSGKRPNPDASEPQPNSSKSTNPTEPERKVIRVDANHPEQEVADTRRGRIELDKAQRDNVLRYILACHIQITAEFCNANIDDEAIWTNVHLSQQVTSIFTTVHNCLRQQSLSSGHLRTTMLGKDHNLMCEGKVAGTKSHLHLCNVLENMSKSFGLEYTKPLASDKNHWYGTASPIICFINMFKVRLNELRVGHGTMTTKRKDDTTYTVSLSQYGLHNVHHPLLEGITVPPERKSGMAQSLGPMTSLVCLSRCDNDPRYSARWIAAVEKDLSFLPEIDSVVNSCVGKRAEEVGGLFNIIADIVLVTTSREAKRSSFPACMLYLLMSREERMHYIMNKTICTQPTDISHFNFSGVGSCWLYKQVEKQNWACPINEGYEEFIPEIIFHSIWGTYGTDFGILEFMTDNKKWHNRSEMGDCFKGFGTSTPVLSHLISLERFSKMSSANQTGLLSMSSNPMIGKSSFSGRHRQIFTDEFLEYFESSKSVTTSTTMNIESLKNLMLQVKENLLVEMKANKTQARGTTSWYFTDGMDKEKYGQECKEIPTTKNKLFFQSKQ